MRLLTVGNRCPPWSLGGYENLWRDSAAALRAGGHAVELLTTLPDPSDLPVAPNEVPAGVCRELRWYWRQHRFPPLGLRDTVALERRNHAVLAERLRRFAPDAVVWFAMGGMSLSMLEAIRRAGVPSLGVVADEWLRYGPEVDGWLRRWRGRRRVLVPAAERWSGVPARVSLPAAARWVFISEHLLDSARAVGAAGPDALVAHPGIDAGRFAFRSPAPQWRGRLLYLGRLDPRKGVRTAVQAVGSLPEATLRLDGAGEPALVAELERLAAGIGAADRVSLRRSPAAEVPDVLAGCDAVLFCVEWPEPWGLVPLEAMATGRPVIATRAGGGPAEYLRAGVNCLLVPPRDPEALATAVRRLAGDPALRAQLIDGGRETAARFPAAGFHERVATELEDLLGPPCGGYR